MFYFYAYQISLQSKFPGSQCLGTGMTGEEGYLDDALLVGSNHNVRTVMRQA
ncbi:hypothetical protein [Wolbachia endosymbiont (group A) of Pipizella viduata]|uniref:hypothetical protein n=1 Tax=Wolbachia endosymbiont (group A) of Pipizella viduata TaxID=3066154 RepID=UPI00333E9BA8